MLTDPTRTPQLVVALGASAGGLAALQEFFQALPERCQSLAFVVVQHLSPDHETVMADLLQRSTSLPVTLASQGLKLQSRTITLCPPGQNLSVHGGVLSLREPRSHPQLPIDYFLHSLAEDLGDRAVALIFSGMGSDGAQGLLAVKESGGLVMVQAESGAEYTGMPRAALETGAADFVLAPARMAAELANYLEHQGGSESLVRLANLSPGELLETLKEHSQIDFSEYKKDMLMRRFRRRMAVRQSPTLNHYGQLLSADRREVSLLTRDILIGVTRFFRDPDAFQELDHKFVKPLLESQPERPLRIWVAGCSTGEEVYSLVILFQERAARLGQSLSLKVFATDLDGDSLRVASLGTYRETIAADVPPDLLNKYFVARPDGFQVVRSVRDCVVFSIHNVTKDPPFTNLSLISCRNLLIYFEAGLKRKVLSFFHFGLESKGGLFLGASETPLELQECFSTTDAGFRIYQKLGFSTGLYRWPIHATPASGQGRLDPIKELGRALDEGYRILLEEHCPPAVLVDPSGQVLHVFVNADRFLKFPAGAVLLGLTDLLSPRLAAVASAALSRAFREDPSSRSEEYPEIVVSQGDGASPVGLRIRPFFNHRGSREFALVTIRLLDQPELPDRLVTLPEFDAEAQQHILTLSQDLQQMRSNFQVTVEELETTNEELQATNEEFQSTSQEYQATAEQLRRELKAASQETLELNHRSQLALDSLRGELSKYKGYLDSSQPAVLFLDDSLRIVLATRGVSRYLPVLEQDVGRPVEHIAGSFEQGPFLQAARKVLASGSTFEDVWTLRPDGSNVSIGMRPFGETGVAVSFAETALPSSSVLEIIQQPAATINGRGQILASNAAWRQLAQPAQEGLSAALAAWSGQPRLAVDWLGERAARRRLQLALRPWVEGQAVHLVTAGEEMDAP